MVAHLSMARAIDGADSAPIAERYFTSQLIDAHLPDSYYSLQFVCVYLSKGGRAIARGLTELARLAGVSRSTASVALRGLVSAGFQHAALRAVGGRPLRKIRNPRGGRNILLAAFQVMTLAVALEAGRLSGFHIRLLLWLVDNIAEDGPGGCVGFRRNDIATRLGVSRRRVTEGVRALEREGLLRVHRGRRGRWTLTPLHAVASQHPKPASVLKAAHVARELADDPRDPAAAIEAASWAASRRARRAARRGTESNTSRGTQSNTPPPVYRASSQVGTGIQGRVESVSSRGSSLNAVSFLDRLRATRPDLAEKWEKRRSRKKRR